MAAAVNRIIAMQGGFVVAAGGEIRAELALPVAGLMSLEPFETVRAKLMRAASGGEGARLHACRSRSCRSPSCRCRSSRT